MSNTKTSFQHWCIVELFGHTKISGHCTEENIAGSNMLRVDVPESKTQPAFTKYYGSSAIYAINPVDETTARMAATKIEAAPIAAWQGKEFITKFKENQLALVDSVTGGDDLEDEDEDHGF